MRAAWYWTSVALLLGAAAFLGYLLLRAPASPSPSPQAPEDLSVATSTATSSPPISDEDRAAVLRVLPLGAPDAERDARFALMKRLAVRTDTVDISGCSPEPLVAMHRNTRDLVFTNKDAVAHEIQINPQHHYKVPAQGSIAIKPDFGQPVGVYGYGCDSSVGLAGILYIQN
jgi:hypothetical protein